MKIKILFLFAAFTATLNAQVTIGMDATPRPGALLDLKEQETSGNDANANKGLGLPRVGLLNRKQLFPMFEADGSGYKDAVKTVEDQKHIGLIVYNSTDNSETEFADDEILCQGPYVWDGSMWVRILTPCIPGCVAEDSENCIIISPTSSDTTLIPVGRAYKVWAEMSELGNIQLDGKVSVELLWQDTQSLIKSVELANGDQGQCSQIKIMTNADGKVGNALVVVRVGDNGDSTDPIRWSWHLWVTDYDPDSTSSGNTYTGSNGEKSYTFMDRNLGATTTTVTDVNSMGLLYQWGRKDPFTSNPTFEHDDTFGKPIYDINNTLLTEVDELLEDTEGTGIQHKLVTLSNNLGSSIENPKVVYYGAINADPEAPADWYTSDETGASSNNNLWETDATQKSVFDPCPKGWRVPVNSTSGKMPWNNYISPTLDEDEPEDSPADFITSGVNMQLSGGSDFIGFYPFGSHRIPRELYKPCGFVGSGNGTFSGGTFYRCLDYYGLQEGYYWTASPGTGVSANMMKLYYDGASPMAVHEITQESNSRSSAASVRCVKIDTE